MPVAGWVVGAVIGGADAKWFVILLLGLMPAAAQLGGN